MPPNDINFKRLLVTSRRKCVNALSIKIMQTSKQNREFYPGNIVRSASLVALGTIISRILGFFRDLLIAHYFSRVATDVFVVAFRLPNLVRRFFGEGALSSSFIPIFIDTLKNKDQEKARELVSALFTFILTLLTICTLLGIYFNESIMSLLTHFTAFNQVPGKFELVVHQSRIMLSFAIFISIYAIGASVLNALNIFWLPALAPAFWNLTLIVGILFLRKYFYFSSDVLAWATLAGGVIQAVLLLPLWLRSGLFPYFSRWWLSLELKSVFKKFVPSLIGISVLQIGILVNTYFASGLEEGSNSWMFWADRLLELPLALFALSLGTATLPQLSSAWAQNDQSTFRALSLKSLRLAFFLALPSAIGLFVLAKPIIQTLFEHGQFTNYDTLKTSEVLRIYSLGVIFAALVRVISPVFFAMKNSTLPALAACAAIVFHALLAVELTPTMGVKGLAVSFVAGVFINSFILLIAFKKTIGAINYRELTKTFVKYGVCGGALAIVASLYFVTHHLFNLSHLTNICGLLTFIALGLFTYIACSKALGILEFQNLKN
jgi:putative peptidoglycan lipid II flippase